MPCCLDESGNVDPFSGSRFLVVTILVTLVPRSIELHVKRARKSLGKKPAPSEMKASTSEPKIVERLLKAIAQENVEIVAVIVDKQSILRAPRDSEDIYRLAVTKAITHCVERWPRGTFYLDKRYTKRALRYQLEETIREGLVEVLQEVVLIRQEDSLVRKELQAGDHTAFDENYSMISHGCQG
ncbi:MAG: hypothetical protein ACE5NP_03015 [Anaerolineae bacterium]